MNKQRKVLITITYNEMGIIIDTKAEEVAQPNLQPTCPPVNPQEPKTGWIPVNERLPEEHIAWIPLPQPYEPQERSDKEMTRRTKGEKEAYLDGFEMCAECIESYLTSAGRQQLERLLVAVKNAANIEDFTERQEGAYNKCPICVNRNKNCQFGSSDCHFEEQTDVAESENKG